MGCRISEELLKKTISFHGHNCPGVSIGIRAAEYALQEFEGTDTSDLLCVTETDMCAVDAIQFLTGCTFGKGNLLHLDYGKAAFSFFDRKTQRARRFVLRRDAKEQEGAKPKNREELIRLLMAKPLNQLFTLHDLAQDVPRSARILQSMVCQGCGEETMESRTRRFDGQTLCIPCFEKVEQKK